MGQYRATITAVGGHGCRRDVKDGEDTQGCGSPACPDCIIRKCVQSLKLQGSSVEAATLEHWPGTPEQVTDDLLTGKRTGSF